MSLQVKVVNEKSVDLLEKLAFDGFLGLAVAFFLREEALQRRAALNFFPCNHTVVNEKSGFDYESKECLVKKKTCQVRLRQAAPFGLYKIMSRADELFYGEKDLYLCI